MSNDLDLSLSLLEGIHEDDHEKITSLKNNSFTDLNQINNCIAVEKKYLDL